MMAAVVTASSLVALLSAREYKYGGGFDAGDCGGDDGSCNNGFDGDGTSRWRRQLLCWRRGNNIWMAAAVKPSRIIIIVANDNDNIISIFLETSV